MLFRGVKKRKLLRGEDLGGMTVGATMAGALMALKNPFTERVMHIMKPILHITKMATKCIMTMVVAVEVDVEDPPDEIVPLPSVPR
jgi:hypothetical protein